MKELKDYINLYIGQLIQHTLNDDNDIVISRVTGYYSDGIEVQLVHNGEHKCILPHFKDAKLILRRLESMTDEECNELVWIKSSVYERVALVNANDYGIRFSFQYASSSRRREQVITDFSPEMVRFLLTKGFDLFGLINAGLAIEDKSENP
jgi:hypothetical protein